MQQHVDVVEWRRSSYDHEYRQENESQRGPAINLFYSRYEGSRRSSIRNIAGHSSSVMLRRWPGL
jgi:hypothetical protein